MPVYRGRVARVAALLATLAGLSACDDARISVGAQPMASPLDTATVRYRIEAGVMTWTANLPTAVPANGDRASKQFDTPTRGQARVSFALVLSDGREVASGDATVPLRGDWQWGFDLFAKTEDPALTCFGCVGSKSFALPVDLRAPGRDSLWLVWGGNKIRNPDVY